MKDIKIKDRTNTFIKTLDKSVIVSEKTKDNLVSTKEKINNANDKSKSQVEYASEKITKGTKDSAYVSTKVAKKEIKKSPERIKKTTKNAQKITKKGIKTSKKVAETSVKVAKRTAQATKRAVKVAVKTTKAAVKATVAAIKAMIAGLKALVSAIAAGGWIAVVVILIICLVGLLCASMFGIFFSSDKNNQIKMSDCIVELNEEMDRRIEDIEKREIHDEVVIESNKANWSDVLAVYAVRVSNNNKEQVMIIDESKKKILREVFWDMNNITSEIKVEKYTVKTIDSRVHVDINGNSNFQRPTASDIKHYDVETESEVEKRVLHIYINQNSIDSVKTKYNFSLEQNKQLTELTSDKYITMWASAIYGTYGSSGEITTWKQKGREWSNIKLGSSNKTIGDVGCLVTSVAILIKKSGVSTKGIYPFNPGTFVVALNNVYGFDGANLQYGPISKVVPGFVYQDRVMLKGKTKNEKFNIIKKYYENGYYIAIEVAGATETAQHWVAVDNVSNNRIIMLDPGSEATDMWSQYDWNLTTQFVYFKATN